LPTGKASGGSKDLAHLAVSRPYNSERVSNE